MSLFALLCILLSLLSLTGWSLVYLQSVKRDRAEDDLDQAMNCLSGLYETQPDQYHGPEHLWAAYKSDMNTAKELLTKYYGDTP